MTWEIQIDWNGRWITVQTGFKSQDAAEWATGQWKQANDCRGDPFRAVLSSTTDDPLDPTGAIAQQAEFVAHGG